ncbi:hypothetical protein BCV70DRAFT_39123 [Testicularia cyperi]|uniref:Uncharacterized protein n=1 Tax=Testicularia cyperi TaxID=1882483 RepID=A0A317XIA3_9BASI|nr:hypothetical protein BCV70DRAFT_39123 [Testicularia cyperi]
MHRGPIYFQQTDRTHRHGSSITLLFLASLAITFSTLSHSPNSSYALVTSARSYHHTYPSLTSLRRTGSLRLSLLLP